MRYAPIVTLITAFPFCLFVWAQVRKNIRLNSELQRLVNRDRLTDVATREYFFNQMEQAPQLRGVALMIDIDHFKRINDTYGHLAGDAVIQKVAKVLAEGTRQNDIVCRFGGEEFLIFLSDYTVVDGYAAAERLRQSVAETFVQFDDKLISVSISIGGFSKESDTRIDRAIRGADDALYRAKNAGRDQTIFADHTNIMSRDAVA
ncbi:GGDEF domain-containing protein [Loktanella agnita]